MKWPRRLLFSLLPLLLLVGGAEGLARLVGAPEEPPAGEDYQMPVHPTRLWAPRPNATMGQGDRAIRINAQGLRELPLSGAPLRILTLGDSNIFGHDLADADTLQLRLRDALARRGVQADVLCGGVPGYSSEQSRALLNELGWSLEPDLILIANLLSDSTHEHFHDRDWIAQLQAPHSRLDEVLRASAAWAWLRRSLVRESRIERRIRWIREPNLRSAERVSLAEYQENLRAMLGEAAARGVGGAIFQLATTDRYAGHPDAPDYVAAQRAIATEARVPIVDAVEVLRAAGLPADRAFIDPVHASGEANGLYAEALADALVRAGWPQERLIAAISTPSPSRAP